MEDEEADAGGVAAASLTSPGPGVAAVDGYDYSHFGSPASQPEALEDVEALPRIALKAIRRRNRQVDGHGVLQAS